MSSTIYQNSGHEEQTIPPEFADKKGLSRIQQHDKQRVNATAPRQVGLQNKPE
ncbi:MAG: hypothetical protein WCK63_08695 [Betaproteobacteria bacterium]